MRIFARRRRTKAGRGPQRTARPKSSLLAPEQVLEIVTLRQLTQRDAAYKAPLALDDSYVAVWLGSWPELALHPLFAALGRPTNRLQKQWPCNSSNVTLEQETVAKLWMVWATCSAALPWL